MELPRSISIIFFLIYTALCGAQHSVERLPSPINTNEYDETCPVMSYNEEVLFFTRVGSPDYNKSLMHNGADLHLSLSEEAYGSKLRQIYSLIAGRSIDDPERSSFNQDVWYARHDSMDLSYPVHPGAPLNNALPNSICSNFNKDHSFVVVNEFHEEGGMSAGFSKVTMHADGSFSFPDPIKIKNLKHSGTDINLAMSTDAQRIFLAMEGYDTKGDQDLYVSTKLLDQHYTEPINLECINTPYREATPYISQDRTKLYFASDRPGGYGGMDIYVCDRLDYSYQHWSEPRLIGPPVNSPADDSYPYVALDEDLIYFTTNRDRSSDIYRARLIRDTVLQSPITINLVAINAKTNERMTAIVNWGEAYEEGFDEFFNTRDGRYTYVFEDTNPIKFLAENRGIKSQIEILDPVELALQGITEVELRLVMEKDPSKVTMKKKRSEEAIPEPLTGIEKELVNKRKVVLKSIKFLRAKPDVLAESFPALEELASVLARRKDLKIRIEGHTDNVGDPELLLKLSEERADAIKAILISKGANESQIETVGYGHTKALNGNRNEKERQENRRVEIRIMDQKKINY